MNDIFRTYRVSLQTLTPLHIGTGVELEKDIDFIAEGRVTHRLNVDRILDDLWEEKFGTARPSQILQSIPAAERKQYYLYDANGTIRAGTSGSKLRECIKTADHQPFIPGSSLKGAIRTALAWSGWESRITQPLTGQDFANSRYWAGQGLEKRIFRGQGKGADEPNHDLMRAFQIGDLHLRVFPKGWQVLNINVAKRRDFASPIEAEAISDEAVFRGRLTIEDFLFSPMAQLPFRDRKAWLETLTQRINQFSRILIERLIKHFGEMSQPGANNIKQFFQDLHRAIETLPTGHCVLCLGWGGGWDSKTFSTHLQRDTGFFEREIIGNERYKLDRGKGRREPGDPFPGTRRVLVKQDPRGETIRAALGWCKVEFKAETQ